MKQNQARPIGEMIRRVLREQGLESPLNEYRLVQSWHEVLGDGIASYTSNLYIKNQVLHVHLSSPALRQELSMCRQRLIHKLNEHVGAQVIVEIQFH